MSIKSYSLEEALKSFGKDIINITDQLMTRAESSVQFLAAQAYDLILQETENLGALRDIYTDNLGMKKVQDNFYVVYLLKPAEWIENGQPAHNMLDYLLKSPKVKTSKEGHKYLVVPFEHSKAPTKMSANQRRIATYAKEELKKLGLDKPIMRNGKPVIGRAASVDISGPDPQKPHRSSPILHGLTIYQRLERDKRGKTKIHRDIMTFRVASEKHRGIKWNHPGRQAANLFGKIEPELDKLWNDILTDIVGRM